MSLCTVKKSWWDPSTVAAVPWFLSWVFVQLAVETMVRQLPMHLPHMQRGAGCKTSPLTLPFHPPSSHRSLSLWRCHTGVSIQKVMHRKRYLSNYRQTITCVKIVTSNKLNVKCNIAGFTHISWLIANLSLLISWFLQSTVFTIHSTASTAKRNMPNYSWQSNYSFHGTRPHLKLSRRVAVLHTRPMPANLPIIPAWNLKRV